MHFYKEYFCNEKELTQREYKYAKIGFTISDSAAGISANIAGGSYLAAFLAFLGANEATSNFIMSLGIFVGFLMFLLPAITKNMVHKKPLAILCYFVERFSPAVMFFAPFIFGISKTSLIAIAVLYSVSYIGAYFMNPLHMAWFMDCVEPCGKVASFCGIKDSVSNGTLILAFFALAAITKHFTGSKEIYAYLIFGITLLILAIIRMGSMVFVKEPYSAKSSAKKSPGISETFKNIFTLKKIKPYLVYSILYTAGAQLINTLGNIVYVQRFNLPLEFLSYILVMDLVLRTVISPFCGKLTDKLGSKALLSASLIVFAVVSLLHAFMTPENAFVIRIIIAVLTSLAQASYAPSSFLFLTESLPTENRSSYIACASSVFYFISYVTSLMATWFISVANGFKINVLGFDFSEVGIVFIFGTMLLLSAGFYISKQKKS